jgi:hypothetical protein
LTLVLLLVLGLLLLRWLRWRNEPRLANFRRQWSAVLMECAMGDAQSAPRPVLRPRERWLFMKLWLHCQMSLKGPSRNRLAALARNMGCQSTAMDKLASRYAAERLMAIREHLMRGSQQTALHAARALLEIDAQQHAAEVVHTLLAREDLDFSLASVLLKPFRSDLNLTMRHAAQQGFASGDSAAGLQWLHMARALSLQVPQELLATHLAQTHDIDLLIAAIRLMQGERGSQLLTPHASHDDWRVRAQVAQALGRIGQRDDVDLLVRMTTDAQWWVRYRATQALFRIPGLPPDRVQSLIEATGDRFALNMLDSVLSEHEALA